MEPILINLAVEDTLSEAVIRTMLIQSNRNFSIGVCLNRGGYGYLKKIISGLNNAAKGTPYFVLTDLDRGDCPLALIAQWLPQPQHPNLIFRIAVREVEAWVLAHKAAFSEYLGIAKQKIPDNVDTISDPKQFLINLARKSRKRAIRDAIVPASNSTAQIGKDYNAPLISFVQDFWKADQAIEHSESLSRAMAAIRRFEPI